MPVAWQGVNSLLIPNSVILNLHYKMSTNIYISYVMKNNCGGLSAFSLWQLSPVQPLAGLFYVRESAENLNIPATP